MEMEIRPVTVLFTVLLTHVAILLTLAIIQIQPLPQCCQ